MIANKVYDIKNKKQVCPFCGVFLSKEKTCIRCFYNTWYFIENDNEIINISLNNKICVIITENMLQLKKDAAYLNIDLPDTLKKFEEINNSIVYIRNPKTQYIDLETVQWSYDKEEISNKAKESDNTLSWYKKVWSFIKEVMSDLEDSANNRVFKKENK